MTRTIFAVMMMTATVAGATELVTADRLWDDCEAKLDPTREGDCSDPRLESDNESTVAIVSAKGVVTKIHPRWPGVIAIELVGERPVEVRFDQKKNVSPGDTVAIECAHGFLQVESKKVVNPGVDSDTPEYEHYLSLSLSGCKLKAVSR